MVDFWTVIFLVAAGIALLALALFVISSLYYGVVLIFGFAAEQGFIGIAAYIACWVFLAPVMLVATFLVGACFTVVIIIAWNEDRKKTPDDGFRKISSSFIERKAPSHRPRMGTPEYYEWANREGRYHDT